jgi:hypothetical protein
MRRIPAPARGKSPQTRRARTKDPKAPADIKLKTSTPPMARRAPAGRSDVNPRITSGPDEKLKTLSTAAYPGTAETAARLDRGMKSVPRENHVPLRKARKTPEGERRSSPVLMIASSPKNRMICAPSRHAPSSFAQYRAASEAEFADAVHVLEMAPNPEYQAGIDHARFFTEGRDFLSRVQAYRRNTGDTSIDSTPPTAEQFAACEAELKRNDKEYQRYAYYLNHRNNKPHTMNGNIKSDFVEYGVLSDLIPRYQRPRAEEIYSAQFLAEIKGKFKVEGAHVFTTAEVFLRYAYKDGFHGRPTPSPDYPHGDGEMFNTENEAIQEIYRMAGPDPTGQALADAAQKVLGLSAFSSQTLLHIYIPPKAIRNERLPSGREHGANHRWLMGGTTPYGHLELITDRVNMAGIPGTDPNETAPTVRILGERGQGVTAYPGNYLSIGKTLIEMAEADTQKALHKSL